MVDYADSSQLNLWLMESPEQLSMCRAKANFAAREFLASNSSNKATVSSMACGFRKRLLNGEELPQNYSSEGLLHKDENPFLTPQEEEILVSFYVSKLPLLIGPNAQVVRLRRDPKVTSTAAVLLRRFFLSNSVMLFDPKAIMVAAAFLASKVEDATADVRYLEEGTIAMNAPVAQAEIIPSELQLLSACHFDLFVFHPFKAIMAFTEDLRVYLKSDKGQLLVAKPVKGSDLKPIYDAARALIDDVIVSDLPFLYNPGQLGLAALMVASQNHLQIDWSGYFKQRLEEELQLNEICDKIQALASGKYGCGNYGVDMNELKAIHKKLKKVRHWGKESKKKRNKAAEGEPEAKKQKTS